MNKILLLLTNEEDQEYFQKVLEKKFQIVLHDSVLSFEKYFDLCILNKAQLLQFQNELTERKRLEKYFLPILLVNLTPKDNFSQINLVDEIITTPINKTELFLRIKNLLARRNLSKILNEIKDENRIDSSAQMKPSEDFFKLVFDYSPDAIFIHPWQKEGFGKFIHVNRVACERYGYTFEEFLNLSVADISSPEDVQAKGAPEVRKILKEKGRLVFEAMHISKDGKKIPVEISSRIFEYGGKEAILAIARDISERKKVSVALSESENRYRNLFKNSPVPLWEEDYSGLMEYLNTIFESGVKKSEIREYLSSNPDVLQECARRIRIVDVNQAAVELHEAKTKKNLLGNLDKIFVESSYSAFIDEIVALLKGQKRFQTEAQVKTLTGKIKDIYLSYVALLEETAFNQKKKYLILLSTMDITPLKNAARALTKSINELDQLYTLSVRARQVEHANEMAAKALAVIDKAITPDIALFYIQKGNELKLLARQYSDIALDVDEAKIKFVGKCFCELAAKRRKTTFSPDVSNDNFCTLEECKKSEIHSFAALPLLKGEETLGVIGLGSMSKRDFSEQKAFLETLANEAAIVLQNTILVEKLQMHKVSLEREVAKRTAELMEANRELESFSYSVSHDLRSPLRAIDGFSAIIQEKFSAEIDDEGKRLLSIVRKNVQRMSNLIDDLLTFSRVGRHTMDFSEVDLKELFKFSFEELTSAEERQRISLKIKDLPRIRADGSLMRQVIMNLLSNAIKFSSQKKNPVIEIGADEEDDEIVFFIKDNGVGFDMKYVDKLFQVFQRLHSEDEFAGTGIGLSIVHRIIIRHGGRVWAEAEPNKGATFYFSLPKKFAISM